MADLLRSDRPDSMRALARMYGSEHYQAWSGLLDSIRDGVPSFGRVFGTSYFDYLAAHPDASSIFNDAMTGIRTVSLTRLMCSRYAPGERR